MTSSRPYLIRAFYEWIVDNGLTPHLIVDADNKESIVPQQHIQDNQIVLNVIPSAIQNLELGNDLISFSARFSGTPFQLSFPPAAVLGIYAKENGRGMLFEPEIPDDDDVPPTTNKEQGKPGSGKKPSLTVVK